MKYKLKVLEPRVMSGEKIGQEIFMFFEEQLDIGEKIVSFGGLYKVLEKQ